MGTPNGPKVLFVSIYFSLTDRQTVPGLPLSRPRSGRLHTRRGMSKSEPCFFLSFFFRSIGLCFSTRARAASQAAKRGRLKRLKTVHRRQRGPWWWLSKSRVGCPKRV